MGNIDNNFPNADQGIPSPGSKPTGPATRTSRGLIPDASSASGRAANDPMLTTTTLGPGGASDRREINQVAVPDDSNKSGITAYHRGQDEGRMLSSIPHGPGPDFPSPGGVYPNQLGKR